MSADLLELQSISSTRSISHPELGVVVHLSEPLHSDHSYSSIYGRLNIPFGLSINHFPKFKDM